MQFYADIVGHENVGNDKGRVLYFISGIFLVIVGLSLESEEEMRRDGNFLCVLRDIFMDAFCLGGYSI